MRCWIILKDVLALSINLGAFGGWECFVGVGCISKVVLEHFWGVEGVLRGVGCI